MPDERFMIHQMKSMKIAIRVGAVLMGVSMLVRYYRDGFFDWHLFGIAAVMGVVKIASLIYYRRTN